MKSRQSPVRSGSTGVRFALLALGILLTLLSAPARAQDAPRPAEAGKAKAAETAGEPTQQPLSHDEEQRRDADEARRLRDQTLEMTRRTEKAQEMATRVDDAIEELKKMAQEQKLDHLTVLSANAELQTSLSMALGRLENAAKNLHDDLTGNFIPKLEAKVEGFKAVIQTMSKSDPLLKDSKEVLDRMVQETTIVKSETKKLGENISRVRTARRDLDAIGSWLELHKRVNLGVEELNEKLNELNAKMQKVTDDLKVGS